MKKHPNTPCPNLNIFNLIEKAQTLPKFSLNFAEVFENIFGGENVKWVLIIISYSLGVFLNFCWEVRIIARRKI